MARKEISEGNYKGCVKVILEQKAEGVYMFVFENVNSTYPEYDYLEETIDLAKQYCLEDYGVPLNSWVEIY